MEMTLAATSVDSCCGGMLYPVSMSIVAVRGSRIVVRQARNRMAHAHAHDARARVLVRAHAHAHGAACSCQHHVVQQHLVLHHLLDHLHLQVPHCRTK